MSSSNTEFGHSMRKYFLFDEKWVNLNHGCFGTYPEPVGTARSDFLRRVEKAPDPFIRYDHFPLLDKSCERLGEYLHVPRDEIVLLANATSAIATVLYNLTFKERDVILYFESVYDAVELTLFSMQETSPHLCIRKVDYKNNSTNPDYPSHDTICASFNRTVSELREQGYNIKVAVFETISSIPAVRLPFERLTQLCRENNILSLIDGAHGIGQIPLDLHELNADFFVSNCHKWLYVPRGCAVLHVPKRNQSMIRTAFPPSYTFELRSKGNDSPDRFLNQFQAQATADNTQFYCVSAALEFRQQIGGEAAIMEYSRSIAQRGADVVAKMLGTVVLQEPTNEPHVDDGNSTSITPSTNEYVREYSGIRDCAMSNVLLPISVQPDDLNRVASWMQRILPSEYNTSVSFFPYREKLWVRLNGQVYLELEDFEWFAGVMLELCEHVEKGEWAA